MNGLPYWFSDRLALRMARAQEVSATDAPNLHAFAERLAEQYRVSQAARLRQP